MWTSSKNTSSLQVLYLQSFRSRSLTFRRPLKTWTVLFSFESESELDYKHTLNRFFSSLLPEIKYVTYLLLWWHTFSGHLQTTCSPFMISVFYDSQCLWQYHSNISGSFLLWRHVFTGGEKIVLYLAQLKHYSCISYD